MPIDPDLVRVDLLKTKRKIYLSLPENSKERQDFLIASKLTELDYLSQQIPSSFANDVFDKYHKSLGLDIACIIGGLGFGLSLSFMLFGFHQVFPQNLYLNFFFFPFLLGVLFSIQHLWYMVNRWRNMKPFKEEFYDLQNRIAKLSDEIRNIK